MNAQTGCPHSSGRFDDLNFCTTVSVSVLYLVLVDLINYKGGHP